jgi:hypothetical protein
MKRSNSFKINGFGIGMRNAYTYISTVAAENKKEGARR